MWRPSFVRERRASGKPLGIASHRCWCSLPILRNGKGPRKELLASLHSCDGDDSEVGIFICALLLKGFDTKRYVSSHDASGGLIGSRWMRFTSCRTPIFAQLKCPSFIHFKILSDLRRMSTKIIAVLDEDHATANPAWDTYTSTLP